MSSVSLRSPLLLRGLLSGDVENELDLERHPQRNTGDAEHDARRKAAVAEDRKQQLGSSVCDLGVFAKVVGGGYIHTQLRHGAYAIKGSEMRSRGRQPTQARGPRGVVTFGNGQLPANPSNVLWRVSDDGEHATQEEKRADLNSFDIRPERSRRRWQYQ
ncbi:hypothetical protein EMEDMD4_940040 [Sinorhizobium medicae]|uniref:Uncharacterized protein n=1 Tax=Sinorhizobium medicae TaxID=110321 RepID=A0A508X841_9HYPH|nr:hypothetical protein EMEDMD4_940040 [Sinorhizobium medicae]